MSDRTFNKTEFESEEARCLKYGFRLKRPRGLRKYYCLDRRDRGRYHLATDWLDAKFRLNQILAVEQKVKDSP